MSRTLLVLLVLCAAGGVGWLLLDELWGPASSLQEEGALSARAARERRLAEGGPVLGVVPGGRPPESANAGAREEADPGGGMPPTPVGARFHGVIRGPGGQPTANVRVFLEGPGGTFELTTDAEGRFDRPAPLGRYRATFVGADGGALFVSDLVLDAGTSLGSGLSLTLRPTVGMEVLVLQPQEREAEEGRKQKRVWIPAVGAEVGFVNSQASRLSQSSTTGGEGLALFEGLLSGPHELDVRLSDEDSTRYLAQIRPGELPRIVVQMPERAVLKGKVTAGAGGAGVAGAAIVLRHGLADQNASEHQDGLFETVFASQYDGTFEVSVPRSRAQSTRVRAQGFMQWPATPTARHGALGVLNRVAGPRPKPLLVVLQEGILVRGTLVPPEGLALPSQGLVFALVSRTDVRIPGRSDSAGSFAVSGLSTGRWRMQFETAGWQAPTFRLTLRAEMGPVHDLPDTRLQRAQGLRGRVLDAAGQPVGGARVALFLPDPWSGSMTEGLMAETFSDPSGGWALPNVFRTDSDGLLRAEHGTQVSPLVPVARGTQKPFDLRLLPTGVVTGRVLDAVSQEGVEGVIVRIHSAEGVSRGTGESVETDMDGSFKLPPLLPGPQRLEFEASGYLPLAPVEVTVSAEKPTILGLELDPGIVFAGQCVDAQGTPLPGTKIHVTGTDANSRSIRRTVNADAAGRFRVGGLPEGTYLLRALRSGYAPFVKQHLSRSDMGMKVVLHK